MKAALTDAGRRYLRQLQKQQRDDAGYVNVMVILLLDKGSSSQRIADDLDLDDAPVYRYAHAWQRLGRDKHLLHEARSYWGLLCSAGLAALSREVESGPEDYPSLFLPHQGRVSLGGVRFFLPAQ